MKPDLPAPKFLRSRLPTSNSATPEASPADDFRLTSPEGRGVGEAGGTTWPVARWPVARWPDSLLREPAAVYEIEAEPVVSWPWGDELEEVTYSIRVPVPSGPVSCARCEAGFMAAGPTGYAEDRAICDMCLLEGSSELGMVMALVAVVRAFGIVRPSSHQDYREALGELGAFSRIYEKFAAKSGPPRVFRIPSLEGDL